jgi:hypothetical protein
MFRHFPLFHCENSHDVRLYGDGTLITTRVEFGKHFDHVALTLARPNILKALFRSFHTPSLL